MTSNLGSNVSFRICDETMNEVWREIRDQVDVAVNHSVRDKVRLPVCDEASRVVTNEIYKLTGEVV